MTNATTEPHLFVILGGRGDLTHRKLLPALYRLYHRGLFPAGCCFLGAGRGESTDEDFQEYARGSLAEAGFTMTPDAVRWCNESIFYQAIGGDDGYRKLADRIQALEQARDLPGNRIFYLALPPTAFPPSIEGLGEAGLNQGAGWTRLVIEKPFGRDLSTAEELNRLIHRYFAEEQVYRIDHYLGKETVQNLLVFRFANALTEPIWNRERVERVEITVAESLGIEDRAGYYEKAGAMRDMIQNHLTQLLTLTAMEVPGAFAADEIRNEKVKVLRSVRPILPDAVVFGQYSAGETGGKPAAGYRDEAGVAPDSQTESYVALRLEVNNWRWQGVPFILRTGKRLPRRTSQIVVTFRRPPVALFEEFRGESVEPNRLVITIQPDEGFDLSFEVKAPEEPYRLETQYLRFRYADVHTAMPDAYETLLLDVMNGDATLFVRADEVEAAWKIFTPLLEHGPKVYPYAAGTWGPKEADELLGGDGPWATR
jgi:glucose-6-phosphate 1-dehydrogenase